MNPNQIKSVAAVLIGLIAPYITKIPIFEGQPDMLQFVLDALQSVTIAGVIAVVGWVSNTEWGESFNRVVLATVRHLEETRAGSSKLDLRNLAITIIKNEIFASGTGSWWRRLLLKVPVIGSWIIGSAVDKAASGVKTTVKANSGAEALSLAKMKNAAKT